MDTYLGSEEEEKMKMVMDDENDDEDCEDDDNGQSPFTVGALDLNWSVYALDSMPHLLFISLCVSLFVSLSLCLSLFFFLSFDVCIIGHVLGYH